jgi:transposase
MTNRNHTTAQSDTPTQKLARVVVAIGLLLASVVALGMVPVERAAMRLNTLAPSALFDQFATGAPVNLPRSNYGAALVLRSCDRALSDHIYQRLQPASRQQHAAIACRDLAERAIAQYPRSSLAHLVAARTALILDGYQAAQPHILASATQAPEPSWLAERRITLMLPRLQGLDAPTAQLLTQDIERVLRHRRGATFLRDQLRRTPNATEGLIQVIEALPPAYQRRFLFAYQTHLAEAA